MRRFLNLAAVSLALAGGPALTLPAAAQVQETVAAVVNDEVISSWDVRQRGALILISSGMEPTAEALEEVRTQALRSLVDERLQIQEAREYDIEVGEEQVDAAFADVARQNGSTAQQLAADLARAGVAPQTLRDQLRADIAWRRLVGGRFGSRVRISPVRIRETIDRISANAAKPQYLVSEILLGVDNASQRDQAMAAADRLIAEMAQGAPFQLVARQFSSAPSAASGGDLGWLVEGEMRPEVQSIVSQLQPGQISRPIVTPGGVHIFALRDKRQGADPAMTARVDLIEVTAPASSRAALERAVRRAGSCDEARRAVGTVEGAQAVELGETLMSDLSESARTRVAATPVGGVSEMSVAGDAVSAFVVCSRGAGEGVPSADEVEDRLYQQEVAMLSQRYLRNLRREATIITRQ